MSLSKRGDRLATMPRRAALLILFTLTLTNAASAAEPDFGNSPYFLLPSPGPLPSERDQLASYAAQSDQASRERLRTHQQQLYGRLCAIEQRRERRAAIEAAESRLEREWQLWQQAQQLHEASEYAAMLQEADPEGYELVLEVARERQQLIRDSWQRLLGTIPTRRACPDRAASIANGDYLPQATLHLPYFVALDRLQRILPPESSP